MEYTQEELDALLKAVTEEFEQMQKAEDEAKEKSKSASANSTQTQSAKAVEEIKKDEEQVEAAPKKADEEGPKTQDPMPPEVSASGSDSSGSESSGSDSSGSDSSGSESSSSSSSSSSDSTTTTTSSSSSHSGSESDIVEAEGDDELHKLYAQLDLESLTEHIKCAVMALAGKASEASSGDHMEGSAPPVAPPAEAQAPAAPPADPMGAPVYKNEAGEAITQADIQEAEAFVKSIQDENQKLKLEQEKAKTEQDGLKKHLKDLEDKLTEVTVKLEKSFKLPQARKVITGEDVVIKADQATAPLTTEQIFQKLRKKAEEPNLSPSDRDRIDAFALNPTLTSELKEFLSIK